MTLRPSMLRSRSSPRRPGRGSRASPVLQVRSALVSDGAVVRLGRTRVSTTELHLGLDADRPGPPTGELVLVGQRQEIAVSSVSTRPGGLDAVFVLAAARPWGAGPHDVTPPVPGRYRLVVRPPDEGPDRPVGAVGPPGLTLPDRSAALVPPAVGVEVGLDRSGSAGAGWTVLLTPFRAEGVRHDDVVAAQNQARGAYRRHSGRVQEDLVLLSSFDGRTVTDNPAAVARELTRRAPELRLVWAVANHTLPVPDADTSVLTLTQEWWQTMARARYVVTNAWLPNGFVSRPGQVVLQTWHGTPFKMLGLDRDTGVDRQRRRVGTRRHSGLWDLMIAQNAYSAEVFARTYAYDRLLTVTGYPRNDELAVAGPDYPARLRRTLGLAPEEAVVLYAPTFRDDRKGLFAGLDFARLLADLAPSCPGGVRLLVRGHANTVAFGGRVAGPGVLDVTLYPDVAELFAVADVLVTDYSSAMFDFAVTGRPMVFHVPDLERYAGEVRGTYFDLAATAPGPLTRSTEETAAAVAAALTGASAPTWAERYRDWRATYVPLDDGAAAGRVVDVLLSLP